MKFKTLTGSTRKIVGINKYLIDWDKKSRSKFQKSVKDFFKSYWFRHVVFEEFPVAGTRMTFDFYNANERINGGFFVLSTKVTNLIKDSKTKWEDSPLRQLTKSNNLLAHKHNGFWHPMDTLRDKQYLEDLWQEKNCPWKLWNE